MRVVKVDKLPQSIAEEGHCHGGECCSAWRLDGYVTADGKWHKVTGAGSWGNQPGMGLGHNDSGSDRNGPETAVPAEAVAVTQGWGDDMNGGRTSVEFLCPNKASVMACLPVARKWHILPSYVNGHESAYADYVLEGTQTAWEQFHKASGQFC